MPSDPNDDTLPTHLRLAIGRIARRMRLLYSDPAGNDRISFLELAVLSSLQRKGPTSPSQLAGEERVTAAAIAAALRSLEAGGFVARRPHAGDRRRVVVVLTREGERILSDHDRTVTSRLAHVLEEQFLDAERRQLSAVLTLLDRIAERL